MFYLFYYHFSQGFFSKQKMKWCAFAVFVLMVSDIHFFRASGLDEWGNDSNENPDNAKYDYNYDDYSYNNESSDFGNRSLNEDEDVEDLAQPYLFYQKVVIHSRTGENVVIDCGIQNVQKKNAIVWYKENIVIVNGLFVMRRNVDVMQNNSILIKNVTEEDAGEYYCEVLPEKIRMTARLNLDESLVIFCDGQDVTNRSLVFRQGEKHFCECKSYLMEDVEIKWFIDGQRAENIVPTILNGQMHIENVGAKHNGIYQCLADDASQEPPHGMIVVDVLFIPKVSTYRHYINTEPGGDAELYCDYAANPPANINWLKNKKILNNNYKYLVHHFVQKNQNRTILTIMDIHRTDLGEYMCQIQNDIGISEIKIFIIYEPEYPQLEGMQIDGRKVTLQWLVRSMQHLSEAVLDYKLADAYIWSTVSVVHSPGHVKLNGVWKIVHEMELTPGSWHVRMKAKNSAGWSQFSAQHDFIITEIEELEKESSPQNMVIAASFGGKLTKPTNNATRKSFAVLISIFSSILVFFGPIRIVL